MADLDEFLSEPADTLSAALKKFLAHERKRYSDDRAQERFGLIVPFVIAVIGDKEVATITKRDLGKVDLMLPDFPDRKKIPREHRTSVLARYQYTPRGTAGRG